MIWEFFLLIRTHVCPEPCQTSKRGNFAKIVNDWKPSIIIIAKLSILDVWQGSKYTPETLQNSESFIFYATLRKNCPYSELFWCIFSCIWTEYGEIRSISPYSVHMWEDTDQKISEYECAFHFVEIQSTFCLYLQNGLQFLNWTWQLWPRFQ